MRSRPRKTGSTAPPPSRRGSAATEAISLRSETDGDYARYRANTSFARWNRPTPVGAIDRARDGRHAARRVRRAPELGLHIAIRAGERPEPAPDHQALAARRAST